MSRRRAAVALAVLFAALAVAVAAGVFTHLDQWAVDHLMPSSDFSNQNPRFIESVVPLLGARWDDALGAAADLVTLPAQALVSLVIIAATRRLPLVLAWVAGNAVELLCKHVLVRPALYAAGTRHIVPFDSSFPSGHALRALLVAAAVVAVAPRARPLAGAWVVVTVALLLVAGWHTPSDLAGGVLLGSLALLGARAAGALRARRLRAA